MNINGLELVRAALEDVNAQNEDATPIGSSEDTTLFGTDTGVDSLKLVNLFVAIEQRIEDETGKISVIVDEASMAEEEHPFRTVGTLARYVEKITA